MKKGFLAALAALAVAVATPVTVFAEEGTKPVDSSDTGKATIVLEQRDATTDGIKVGDSATVVNTKWGTSFDANLVVVWTGEAYLSPDKADPATALPLPVEASKLGGTVVAHYGKTGVVSGAKITLEASNLSPVIALGPASSSKVPNTGDSNSNALWIGALGLSVVLAGAAIFMRKRTA